MNTKISKLNVYYIFVLTGFLFPRGFSEVSLTYHRIASAFIWIAVSLIWLQQIKKINYKITYDKLMIATYFILAYVITVMVRKDLSSGLQKLFAVPSLCVFLITNMKKAPKKLLDIINTVMIGLFVLNFVITKIYFTNKEHIIFLGHVQLVSQMGLSALFVACLYWMLFRDKKSKIVCLITAVILTMLTTDADSAVFSAVILLAAFVIYKWKLYSIFCLKTELYIVSMFLLNIFVVYMTAVNRNIIPNLSFSGRNFIWENALLNISNKPLVGYGIDGILLQTFWTKETGGGFNYAHNQILQNLIDGGIVLLIAFWMMIFAFTAKIKNIYEKKYCVLTNVTLIILLFIMIFDSATLYSYMYIPLSLMIELPFLLKSKQI